MTSRVGIALVLTVLLVCSLLLTFVTIRSHTSPTIIGGSTTISTLLQQNTIRHTGLSLLIANGTEITDEYGDIVILRGVDFSGYEYIPSTQRYFVHHKSDYATIASWGFNVVRLPISWDNLEPIPGHYNDSYLQNLVDRDIEWAKQYGIYIVLDMHQVCWSSQFINCNSNDSTDFSAGIPMWAASSYPDDDNGRDSSTRDFFAGLGPNGTTPSPSNPSLLTRFFAVWQHVASRYSNESAIAAYDILNEPPSVAPRTFYPQATDAIRAVDSRHICLWETDVPIQRPNLVYSPHYPQDSLASYNATSLRVDIDRIIGFSRRWYVPIFIGEWGMYASASNVTQYISDSLSLFDTYSISSAFWTYERGNFAMDLFYTNGSARQVLAQNLIRPYIRELTSPITQISTINMKNGSLSYVQLLNSTAPSQVLISIPEGYSIENIQTGYSVPAKSQVIQDQNSLLLTFPSAGCTITIEYKLQLSLG